MDDKAPRRAPKPKRRRWLLKSLVFLGLVVAGGVAGLPWLLGTPPARAWIVGRVNARLAPGSIRAEGVGLSWTRPIGLTGVALVDPKGKVVLSARSVRLDRGILGLLASRPDLGTITVEGASVDVERRADGSIDVLEALGSALKSDDPAHPSPGPSVVVAVKGGALRVASPELVEPLTAESFEGTLTLAPGKPVAVAARLGAGGRSLSLEGTVDREGAGDLALTATGRDWPIHVRQAGAEVRGRLDGALTLGRSGGLWSAKGDAAILGFEATGPALAGDRLALDRVALACDAGQAPGGWSARVLTLTSPVGTLTASGAWPGGGKLEGRVDLAALARLAPRATRLRPGLTLEKGSATIRAEATSAGGSDRLAVDANLDDLAATEAGRSVTLREPARVKAAVVRSGGKVSVETLEVKAAGLDLTARGDLDAGVKLLGTVNLARLDAQARDLLDLGAFRASGHARVGADYRHEGGGYHARLAADCRELDLAGLAAEPIRRELARLDLSASGPRSPDGLPTGWDRGQLDLKSADLKVNLAADRRGEAIAIRAGVGLDVTSPVAGRAEAKAAFTLTGRAFDFAEILAGLTPSDPAAAPGTFALAVRGRLDLATGEASFAPFPDAKVGAFGLLPEGVRVTGLGRPGVPLRVVGALRGDLAALDRMLAAWEGTPSRGLAGAWGTHFNLGRSPDGRLDSDGQMDVPAIVAPGLAGPFSVAWRGGYTPATDRLEIGGLNLATAYATAAMAGDIYEVHGRRIADLKATLDPKWEALDPMLASSVEPGARLRATVRPIHWKGVMLADTTAQLLTQQIAEIALDVTEARAFGITLAPTPVVLHLAGGGAVFDPIRTTANNGPVTLNATLALDDAYGLWLRLLPGTEVKGAEINDAVSGAVLAYVAPVLAQATNVHGKVSVNLASASLPVTATGSMAILGQVVFENVQFLPGPLGNELAGMIGRPAPTLTLHQPMQLQVADGRVNQSGLSIPLGGGARVALDGSVGFDRTLDLRATVPLTTRMLGLDPKFEKLVGGSTLAIPIRGTMARPSIDRRAFAQAIGEAARTAGGRALEAEASGLLERVAGPNPLGGDPQARPGRADPIGTLEDLGRGLLERKKKP